MKQTDIQIGQHLIYNGFGSKVGTRYQAVKLNRAKTQVALHEVLKTNKLDTNGFWLETMFINDESHDWVTESKWQEIQAQESYS